MYVNVLVCDSFRGAVIGEDDDGEGDDGEDGNVDNDEDDDNDDDDHGGDVKEEEDIVDSAGLVDNVWYTKFVWASQFRDCDPAAVPPIISLVTFGLKVGMVIFANGSF